MPILLQLQKLPWKGGDGGWEKVSLRPFTGRPEDREFVVEKKEAFGGIL